MQLAKRFVVAFAVAALALSASAGRDPSFLRTLSGEVCYEPIEGPWYIENRVPSLSGGDELQLDGTVTLNLTKTSDNIYAGTGLLEILIPTRVPDVPVQLAALFDPEDCVLSGAMFAESLGAALLFKWDSIGSQASGSYLLNVNGTLLSQVPGTNYAKYVV